MRFLGREYDGDGITVGIIDSGIDVSDPRVSRARIEGFTIDLPAQGHAMLKADFADEHGHGTEIAAAVLKMAPKVRLVAIKIMGPQLRTSAELMAAGIETAARQGCHVINLSIGTPNMGKALLLREVCAQAFELGSIVLAAAHPTGERAYPADLPETVGVSSAPDCPRGRVFYYDPARFPRKTWPAVTGKFLTDGHLDGPTGERGKFRGSGVATAYLSGYVACLRQARPRDTAQEIVDRMRQRALLPLPEIGFV